jgi:hypothetical protein
VIYATLAVAGNPQAMVKLYHLAAARVAPTDVIVALINAEPKLRRLNIDPSDPRLGTSNPQAVLGAIWRDLAVLPDALARLAPLWTPAVEVVRFAVHVRHTGTYVRKYAGNFRALHHVKLDQAFIVVLFKSGTNEHHLTHESCRTPHRPLGGISIANPFLKVPVVARLATAAVPCVNTKLTEKKPWWMPRGQFTRSPSQP